MKRAILIGLIGMLPIQWASAGIISSGGYTDAAAFSAVTGAVSLTGPPPPQAQIAGLTYQTTAQVAVPDRARGVDVMWSALVCLAVVAVWLYFS